MNLTKAFSPTLPGGLAPACQERDLAKVTSSLDSLTRPCAWTKSFDKTSIKVLEGPLLGTCLAEMTGAPPEPVQPGLQPKNARPHTPLLCSEEPRRHRVPGPICADASDVAKRSVRSDSPCAPSATTSKPEETHFACVPRKLPEQTRTIVDRETLCRIGQQKDPDNVLSRRKQPTRAITNLKRNANMEKRSGSPSVGPRPHREWIRELSQRAVRPVTGESATGFPPKRKRVTASASEHRSTAGADRFPGPTADLDVIRQGYGSDASSLAVRTFPASCATPLDGQRYPQELLAQLANHTEPPSSTKRQSPVPETDRKRLPVPREAGPESISAEPARSADAPLPAKEKPQPGADTVAVNEAEHATQVGLDQVPLRRPRSVPGLVRHHSPLVEEVPSSDEQLSTLAANIQRILDEEARRHGIDV